LLLAAAKFLVPMDQALRKGDWRPRYAPNPSFLLEGMAGLILGYGEIGRRLGCICSAMGMRMRAIRRTRGDDGSLVDVYTPDAFRDLLRETQALMICLPHTPETDGLIGEDELDLLPRDALLINVARGGIVDEGALFRALKSGSLAAAGLDVWYQYPADEASRSNTSPSRFAFSELENVVMSPHRGGGWRGAETRRMRALADLLNAAARGEPVRNRVDVIAGY
jgi:phosphoglycerate dehydrogenase-like enzyme